MKDRLFRVFLIVLTAVTLFTGYYALTQRYGKAHTGADMGDFSGDSDFDFGGFDSDWGSGWDDDDDWGSGWDDDDDWGSSWDDDWDSGFGSGHGTYIVGGNYSGEDRVEVMSGVIIAIWIIVILAIMINSKNRKNKRKGVTYNNPSQSIRTSDKDLRPLSEYRKLDPMFDENKLSQKISNLYVQMQHCWTEKNMEQLRPYFTDSLYAQLNSQLRRYIDQRKTNYVDKIAVMGVKIRGFRQNADNDELIAEVTARITDYTLDDRTGELITGSKTKEKFMTYEYTLTRKSGCTTTTHSGLQTVTCPHCGASVNINESAQCPYCGSVLTIDNKDWAISSMKAISQRTL